MIKKIFLIIPLFSVTMYSVEINQQYLDNAEKYRSLSENKADVEFSKKYEENAKKTLNKNMEYLKQQNYKEPSEAKIDEVKEKYKKLEPTEEQKKESTEKYKNLQNFELNNEYKKEKVVLSEGPTIQRKEISAEVEVENEEQLKDYEKIVQDKKDEDKTKNDFVNNLQYQTKLLDKNNYFNKEIEKIKKENEDYNKRNQTIFFFVSSDMRIESFKGFVEHINKLRKKGHKVIGRVIFRGWIDDKMDGIPNWLKKMQKEGLKNSDYVKYQFHPWAFRYFGLNKVPAYALSSCLEDFRFRTCENKFLIKGDMDLIEFFKILSEEHKEYKSAYRDLIEVNK